MHYLIVPLIAANFEKNVLHHDKNDWSYIKMHSTFLPHHLRFGQAEIFDQKFPRAWLQMPFSEYDKRFLTHCTLLLSFFRGIILIILL